MAAEQWARSSSSTPRWRTAPRPGQESPETRRRTKRSKTALVLGGGGFTGGVYEMGALRALDLLSVNRTVNQFDVYVGTSAGSFVAAQVANGVTPEEMMRVIVQQVPTPFQDARVKQPAAPELPRIRQQGSDASAARGRSAPLAHPGFRPDLGRRPHDRPRRGAPIRPVLGRGDRALRAYDPLRTRNGPTIFGSLPASCTSPRPTSTRASGSCSVLRTGTTCRSRPRSAHRARYRWSTSRSRSRSAS